MNVWCTDIFIIPVINIGDFIFTSNLIFSFQHYSFSLSTQRIPAGFQLYYVQSYILIRTKINMPIIKKQEKH